jgi:uncharacterized protein (DUF4415 family)
VTAFEDDATLTLPDDEPYEERFIAIGMGSLGRVLVVVYTARDDRIRIISARNHSSRTIAVREKPKMKRQYDFSKARRGPVVPPTPGKTRITIRLDNDVIEHFQATVDRAGGGNYQTLINDALREYIRGARLEAVVRKAVRDEVKTARQAFIKTA